MEQFTLNVELRTEIGKGAARNFRRNGYLPAVIYRTGKSTPIKLIKNEIVKFINTTIGEQVMVKLQFSDGSSRLALLKEYQVDPVEGDLLHTDFYEVSLKEKVKIMISIVLHGLPIGVKKDGGVLQQTLSELEVECLPDKIPPHIDVDVSDLRAGFSIHVHDLSIPDDIVVISPPEEVIVTVSLPSLEPKEVKAEEEEVKEPEVIKRGKKEEEERG